MAGIYIHIPFCRQACHYCDFHFSTARAGHAEMAAAIVKEVALQKDYLKGEMVETIYFGGGTPSLLNPSLLNTILAEIHKYHPVAPGAEVTLEANPDDINALTLKGLAGLGINRLSLGLQSFHEPFLQFMNRAHNAQQSAAAVKQAQDAGFSNLTIDLIYGYPAAHHGIWQNDIDTALALQVPHISSYCLTVEAGTALGKWAKAGKFSPAGQDFEAAQFTILQQSLKQAGYRQYEVSNFSLPGCESRHNTAYWQGKQYLGLGPSAHSFNVASRQYNIANNAAYIKGVAGGVLNTTIEELTAADRVNDYLLTTLRTVWGADLGKLKSEYGYDLQAAHQAYIASLHKLGYAAILGNSLVLTPEGLFLADEITSRLMAEEQSLVAG